MLPLDRNTIKIIRRLDPKEITTEQTPHLDILGNEIQEPKITFPNKDDTSTTRRKTFKIFNGMNLPQETQGYIDQDRHLFRIIIEPMGRQQEEKVYEALLKTKKALKDALGDQASISMDYPDSPRTTGNEKVLFRIKNGKIII